MWWWSGVEWSGVEWRERVCVNGEFEGMSLRERAYVCTCMHTCVW
jgi:hypothetical protein